MAKKPKDPLTRDLDEIRTSIEGWQTQLFHLWKVVFKKIKSKLKSAVSFFDKVVTEGRRIASTVGSKVIDKIVDAAKRLGFLLERIPQLLKNAHRLGKKILSIIAKAADPSKIIGTMKRLVTRYINMIKEIYRFLFDFLSYIDALGAALAIINTFKTVLRLVLSWIADVTGVMSVLRKISNMVRKIVKKMKVEIRDAIKTSKKAARLKAA